MAGSALRARIPEQADSRHDHNSHHAIRQSHVRAVGKRGGGARRTADRDPRVSRHYQEAALVDTLKQALIRLSFACDGFPGPRQMRE
jgi:hypothetical protein